MGSQATYDSLTEGRNIRMSTILPGKPGERMCIWVHEMDLPEAEDRMHYEALSYVWGPKDNPEEISLVDKRGEHPLRVTRNLASALRRLRSPVEPRLIWIDAICIDQENDPERSHQVALMGDIYRRCRRTVVWLGRGGEHGEAGVAALRRIAPLVNPDLQRMRVGPSEHTSRETYDTIVDSLERNELLGLLDVMSADWWQRVWIRQEIRLGGKDSIVCCGGEAIEWPALRSALAWADAFDREIAGRLGEAGPQFSVQMEKIRQVVFIELILYVSTMRLFLGRAECSDARDFVYGILNILGEDGKALGIVPDYSKTAADIYREVALAHIKKEDADSLQILKSCGRVQESRVQNLPSWVPDWSTPGRIGGIDNYSDTHLLSRLYTFRASPLGEKTLLLHGVHAATISRAVGLGGSRRAPELLATLLRFCGPLPDRSASVMEKCCRALSAGSPYYFDRYEDDDSREDRGRYNAARLAAAVGEALRDERASPPAELEKFLSHCAPLLDERCLFQTGEGYIGLGPQSCQEADRVYTILGCDYPLALRGGPREWTLLGDCNVVGLMENQPLLGDLPSNLRPVTCFDSRMGRYLKRYRDVETGELMDEDPRVVGLLEELKEEGFIEEATMRAFLDQKELAVDIFRGRGVQLEEIILV